MTGYDAFDDPYSYKGSSTLKNKLGLRDEHELEAFELEMTTLRGAEPLPDGLFDTRHYRSVHHHLFQDIYSWAGKYRSVRTAKSGNWFCFPEHIDAAMEVLFDALPSAGWMTTSDDDVFFNGIAHFLGELNAIHPFREGNGRSQLAFVHLLGIAAKRPFRFVLVRQETFLPAMIASFAGDTAPLRDELRALAAPTPG